jgi:hypothetical protein
MATRHGQVTGHNDLKIVQVIGNGSAVSVAAEPAPLPATRQGGCGSVSQLDATIG